MNWVAKMNLLAKWSWFCFSFDLQQSHLRDTKYCIGCPPSLMNQPISDICPLFTCTCAVTENTGWRVSTFPQQFILPSYSTMQLWITSQSTFNSNIPCQTSARIETVTVTVHFWIIVLEVTLPHFQFIMLLPQSWLMIYCARALDWGYAKHLSVPLMRKTPDLKPGLG